MEVREGMKVAVRCDLGDRFSIAGVCVGVLIRGEHGWLAGPPRTGKVVFLGDDEAAAAVLAPEEERKPGFYRLDTGDRVYL